MEPAQTLRMARAGSGLAWAAVFFVLATIVSQLCLWALRGLTSDILLLATLSVLPAALAVSFVLPRQNGAEPWAGLGLVFVGRPLVLGIGLGVAAVVAVVAVLVLAGLGKVETDQPTRVPLFLLALIAGVAGEELLFRGYGFQQLSRALTPLGAAGATGLAFGVLHYSNPGATPLSAVNTGLFGLLFGVALVRHRSLWLPFGIHLAWNLSLAILGATVSGLTMRLTTLEIVPTGSPYWSGGAYGPEASPLVTVTVLVLLVVVWRQPVETDRRRLIWDED